MRIQRMLIGSRSFRFSTRKDQGKDQGKDLRKDQEIKDVNIMDLYDRKKYLEVVHEIAKLPLERIDKEMENYLKLSIEKIERSAGRRQIFRYISTGLIVVVLVSVFISRTSLSKPNNPTVPIKAYTPKVAKTVQQRLDDVKGIDEIKEEINGIIKMIKDPQKYYSKGASVPKGLLLYGKPGTGKTMLARAIAGEAGITFFYCTGSEFDEMFVGVGAARLRKLFEEAKKNTPCIIFIDEIDTLFSVSRRRGMEHSSSRATITEILTQMDGFAKTQNIVVIGATNNIDLIDPAAIRPGRFDYKIHVPLPDAKGREDIFNLYISKITHDFKIDAKFLAKITPGFSGAEIKNMVNTAIINAVINNQLHATMENFEYARDRIIMGIERKSMKVEKSEMMATAYHETGHTLASYFLEGPKSIFKVTIVPRGSSLGATYHVPNENQHLSLTKEEMMNKICTLLGGHVAEKIFIGEGKVSTGCSNDLERATQIAYAMVRKYGMEEDKVGLASTDKEELSEAENKKVDEAVQLLLNEASQIVEKVLHTHEYEFKRVAQSLFENEYLTGDDIDNIVKGHAIKDKKMQNNEPKKPERQI